MSSIETLTLLLVALIAVVAYFYWMKYKKLRRIIDKIPGPTGTIPIIGDLQIMRQDLAGYFFHMCELCRQNRDVGIARYWMGPVPMVLVFRARVVQDLLNYSSKHSEKSFAYEFFRQWVGDGLLLSTGSKWFSRRKLITPCFHFKILEQFMHIFNEQAAVLVCHLNKVADGPTFDVRPFLYRCTLDVICEAAMGVKINSQADSSSSFLRATDRVMELIIHRMKSPWLIPDLIHSLSPTGREFSKHLSVLHSFTAQVIADRRAAAAAATHASDNPTDGENGRSKRRRLALLDMLLEQENIDSTLQTDKDIQEEVDVFMFGGHDTTAVSSTWSLYMLGSHPEVQIKLQQELDSVLNDNIDRELTIKDFNEMKYLDCFMKETLRLFPAAPLFSRTTSETCTLGGYTVPRGCFVGILLDQLHRDPEFFPDPEKFDPDRWLTDDIVSRHPFCYIPFSAGMRNCIGQKFAMLEVKTILSHILRQFNVQCDTIYEDMVAYGAVTLAPLKPIHLQLEKRQKATSL